jgi:hypothetical protein
MALFKWLWAADPTLPVIPNRGTTSDGDWTAAKAITLPDFRGKSLVGIDGQGFANQNRLAGITFAKGDQVTIGSYGGAAPVKTLAIAEMPSHNHTITDYGHTHGVAVPAHTHTFSGNPTDSQGSHTHTGSTNTTGAHTHSYTASGLNKDAPGGQDAWISSSAGTTGSAGDHSHTFTTGSNGAHTHSVSGSVLSNGPWNINTGLQGTGITSVAAGSGASFQLMAPFVIVSWFMKL